MNPLIATDPRGLSPEELEGVLSQSTIFDKIEFSGITKQQITDKIHDLRTRQVPQRKVLRDMPDEAVTQYWFKNWLHPNLRHWVPKPPKDTRGCSREVLERDARKGMLNFYENGQQNFSYTLADIEQWCRS